MSVAGRAVLVGSAVSVGGIVAVGLRVGGSVAVDWLDESGVVGTAKVCPAGRPVEHVLRSIATRTMRYAGICKIGYFGMVISGWTRCYSILGLG